MTANQQFILELGKLGLEYAKAVLPILLSLAGGFVSGWHLPQPKYMEKKEGV